MRQAFAAGGAAALTGAALVMFLAGALVDEVTAPRADAVRIQRYDGRPDLAATMPGGVCHVDTAFGLAFVDEASAEALGLEVAAGGSRQNLYPCAAVATLLADARGCTLAEDFPPGWAVPALGDLAPCPPPPVVDGGQ